MKNSFFLVIPKQQEDSVRLELYTEVALKQWVDELPRANLSLSTRLLHDFIQDSNKLLMSGQQRLDYLEFLRPSYLAIEEDLRSRLIKTGFPKSDNEHKIYTILLAIEREFSIGYWTVVRGQGRREISWFQGKDVALAIQRVIKGLASIVISQYIMSLPIPEWVWIDLHSLYKLGVKLKKEATKVPDLSCLVSRRSSIQDSYKQCVLLSLADPTGLMPKEVQQVYEFAELLSASIDFEHTKIPNVRRQCLIFQDEDRPAFFANQDKVVQGDAVLYINFTKLNRVFQSKEKLKNDIDGRYSTLKLSPKADRLPAELLDYLDGRWQGVPLIGEPIFSDRLSRYFSIGLDSAYELQNSNIKDAQCSDREYLAESASERALICSFDAPGKLSIGSFISFRKVDQPQHNRSIGIVNKVSMHKSTGKAQFEVLLLTQRAFIAQYTDIKKPDGERQKALIYGVKTPGEEEKSFLIVESFMLKELSVVRLYLHEKNFPIVLRGRKNIGLGYWQFDCRQLDE
ncbi:MAG: hypothetical protein K9L22_04125 [Methylococcaceae bacterium]|nr:hypothetical protein [Methylococcaceae bacterium]